MKFELDESFALKLDRDDPLASFRDKFHIPKRDGRDVIYLSGHSLGLQPKSVRDAVMTELNDWAEHGVLGHEEAANPWIPYHEQVSKEMAEIVGGKPSEVVVMNSLTVNLHLLMVSFYRPTKDRRKIVIEKGAFPSDRYAVLSQLRFHGSPENDLIELAPRPGEVTLRTEDILTTLESESRTIALIMLGGLNYYTGQLYSIKEIAEAARKIGSVVGLDLAHAAGNVPLTLHDWDVDFAAWCSYKYLNAGPGAPAGVFIHEKHHRAHLPRFEGWWGQNKVKRFKMGPDFDPIPTAEAWQISNPPILAVAALKASTEIFIAAGMERIRKKSEQITSYMEFLLESLPEKPIEILTPKNVAERGAQLSIRVKSGGRALFEFLLAQNVICDWREPDVIRLAPIALYNRYLEVHQFYRTVRTFFEKR